MDNKFLLIILTFFIIGSGCIDLHDEDRETDYTFQITLEVPDENLNFTLYCPFLVPYMTENEPYDDKFLKNIISNNSNLSISIEFVNNYKVVNITGFGSFELISKFKGRYWDIDQWVLSTNPNPLSYEGEFDIYFKTEGNESNTSTFHFEYFGGDVSFSMEAYLGGELINIGWQGVEGLEEETLSD